MLHNRASLWLVLLTVLPLVACGPREAGRLPPVGLKVAFENHKVPKEMATGERMTVEVRFKNSSTMAWPSKPNSKGKYAVNFSYHWLSSKGEMVVFEGLRTSLPNDVKAGESVLLQPTIQAPDRPGSYQLELTLVQEGNSWFEEVDDKNKLAVAVNVGAAKTIASAAPAVPASEAKTKDAEAKSAEKAPVETKAKEPEKKSRKELRREAREKAKKEQTAAGENHKDGTWAVQIGAYPDEKDAVAAITRLKDKGYDAFVTRGEIKGKRWYRVRVGRLATRAEAEALQKKLASQEKTGQSVIVANR